MASTSQQQQRHSRVAVAEDRPPTYESVIGQTPPSYDSATQQQQQQPKVTISYIELPEERRDGIDGGNNGEEARCCKTKNSLIFCCFVIGLFALGMIKYVFSSPLH